MSINILALDSLLFLRYSLEWCKALADHNQDLDWQRGWAGLCLPPPTWFVNPFSEKQFICIKGSRVTSRVKQGAVGYCSLGIPGQGYQGLVL